MVSIVRINKNIKLIVNYFLGPLVFLLLLYSIREQVLNQRNWEQSVNRVLSALKGPALPAVLTCFFFMAVNWGIEALKWRIAIRKVQKLSFAKSFMAILSGVSFASFTPNRIGEYFGRILFVEEGKKMLTISLSLFCSISQLMITLACGVAGLLIIPGMNYAIDPGGPSVNLHRVILVTACITSLVFVFLSFLYFRAGFVIRWLKKMPAPSKLHAFLLLMDEPSAHNLGTILILSFIRYIVFLLQYYLLFLAFDVNITWWQLAVGMSVVFLVMAIVPTFTFLTELGLRWKAGIEVMTLFSVNTAGIFAASFGIWLINLVIPALLGSLCLLSIKLFRSE